MIMQMPLIFRKEIYAFACVVGGIFFTIGYSLNLNMVVNEVITALIVILVRILAVKYHWELPRLKDIHH